MLKMAVEAKEKTDKAAQEEKEQLELMQILLDEQSGKIQVPEGAVARVGTTYYNTLQEAIEAVPTDNTRTTVSLLKNVSEYITIEDSRNVALYLNGNTISPDLTVTNEDENPTVNIKNGSSLMVANGKVIANEYVAICSRIGTTLEIASGAEIIGENVEKSTVRNAGKLTITGGKIVATQGNAVEILVEIKSGIVIPGEMTISGGEIIAESPEYATIFNDGKLSITGGKIIAGQGKVIVNTSFILDSEIIVIAECTISGGEFINKDTSGTIISNEGKLNVISGNIISEEGCAIDNRAYEWESSGTIFVGELNILGGQISSNKVAVRNVGKLNIEGGIITSKGDDSYAIYNRTTQEESGDIIIGEVTISNGQISSNYDGIRNKGKLNITGGTISAENYGINNKYYDEATDGTIVKGEVTITGGQVSSNYGAISNYGILTATGGTITGVDYAIYNRTEEHESGVTITGESTIETDSVTINGDIK